MAAESDWTGGDWTCGNGPAEAGAACAGARCGAGAGRLRDSLDLRPRANVAELESDTSGAQTTNIASLTEVVNRNPGDARAYNTRGAAYARIGAFRRR